MSVARPARRWWAAVRLLLGFAVSAGALYVVLRRVSWPELYVALAGAHPLLLALAALLYPWRLVVISWRWGELLSLYGETPPFWPRLRATCVGYLFNNLLPLRSGDVLRGGLAVQSGASLSATVSSLLLEKVLDLWALVALGLLCGSAFLSGERLLSQSLRGLALVAGVSLVVFLLVAVTGRGAALSAWCELRSGRGARLAATLVRALTESCELVRRPGRLGITLLATAVNWSLEGAFYLLVAHALGLPLTVTGAAFLVAVIGLGLTVPTTAGGIGWAQYLAVLVLRAQGMPLGAATAYSLLSWLLAFAVFNLAGIACLLAGPGRRAADSTVAEDAHG